MVTGLKVFAFDIMLHFVSYGILLSFSSKKNRLIYGETEEILPKEAQVQIDLIN